MKNFIKSLFKLGGDISPRTSTYIGIIGFIFIIFVWHFLTDVSGFLKPATVPSPKSVFFSFFELYSNDKLLPNIKYSIGLNIIGYIEAICISIPIGFLIALFPFTRSMFSGYVVASRYLPLTGLTGVFIAWFGIGFMMKAHFLAFGIIVYLLPIVIQRVYETEKIHLDTVWTLGANSWQQFTKVYLPSVLSKVFNDIKVITAISWTYIIVAEMVNNEGGVGAMVYSAAKQSRIDKIFAIMLIIILIGFIQDKIFEILEKVFLKFKFVKK